MQNNKSPCRDSLTKEFYEVFWEDLKTQFPKASSGMTNLKKKIMANWRQISVLNLIILFIKKYLPFFISSNQTAYVEGRFIRYLTNSRFLKINRVSSNS